MGCDNKYRARLLKAVNNGDLEAYVWALVKNVEELSENLMGNDAKKRIKNDLKELAKNKHSIEFDKKLKQVINE